MGVTTVHVIPHSHTDPGWLDTADGYYTKDVRSILSNVFAELEAGSNRTFVWSETVFFARWWDELNAARRVRVRALVDAGRLEFAGGGWVQHDEALPTVGGMIESMAEGHDWLYRTLGVRPTVGWQLDPFGHSAASTALLGRMGLRAVVINRIHHKLKQRWRSARHLEFEWEAAPSLHWVHVLTHVLHTHYATPRGVDFENGTGVPYMHMCMHVCIHVCAHHACLPAMRPGLDFEKSRGGLSHEAADTLIALVRKRAHRITSV